MLPSPTATATTAAARASGAAAAGHAAESGRTLLVILRPVFGGEVLADDENITLFQVAFDHFRRSAVSDTEPDQARLWVVFGAQHPDDASLPFRNGRGCRHGAGARPVGAREPASARLIAPSACAARCARAGGASTPPCPPSAVGRSLLAVRPLAI